MSATPIAKMVRQMIERGVDIDVIELAVSTAELTAAPADVRGHSADISADKRRAADRERKRKLRGNPQNSADIPRTDDSALTILENSSQKKPEKKERAKSSRGEKLPPDAKPSAEQYQFGIDSGFNRDWVDQQFEDMRIWARTNEHRAVARKSDWDLTFTGWLRRSAGQAKGRSNGNGTGDHRANQASGQSGSAATLAGVAAAAERRGRERRAGGPEPGRQAPRDADAAREPDFEFGRTPDGRGAPF